MRVPGDGRILSGVLIRRNFNYHLMHADDLSGMFMSSFFSFTSLLVNFSSFVWKESRVGVLVICNLSTASGRISGL